jgi:phosphohistidine phosphatase
MPHSLIIMRHASAERGHGSTDRQRALSVEGHEELKLLAAFLRQRQLPLPTLILASAAQRTQETATGLAAAMGWDCPRLSLPALYEAYVDEMTGILSSHAAGHASILVVGHNPTMEGWIQALHDHQALPGGMDVPPATLAQFTGTLPPEGWRGLAAGSLELQFLIRPRELLPE